MYLQYSLDMYAFDKLPDNDICQNILQVISNCFK